MDPRSRSNTFVHGSPAPPRRRARRSTRSAAGSRPGRRSTPHDGQVSPLILSTVPPEPDGDPGCERLAEARQARDLPNGRGPDPLDGAEPGQKGLLPTRSDPRNLGQFTTDRALLAQLAVVGHRKAMGFVADPLQEVQRAVAT